MTTVRPSRRSALTTFILTVAMIAFVAAGQGAGTDLRALAHPGSHRMLYVKAEGKPAVFVDVPNARDVGSACFSPDGKQIAFDAVVFGDAPGRKILLVNADGTSLQTLLDGCTPRWAADGKSLCVTCFTGSTPDETEIFQYELASKKSKKLADGRFGDWSPDGKQLVFARGGQTTPVGGTHFDSKLFVAKADGSEAKEFTDGDWPAWSPDGRWIASCIHETYFPMPLLFTIDVATKKRTKLGAGFYRPQWAPDGKSIVANGMYFGGGRRVAEIAPVRFYLDKSRVEFIHLDLDMPWSPCFSQDGKSVLVIVDSAGGADLPAAKKGETKDAPGRKE